MFVAALAVIDDIISILTIAIFYARGFELGWLLAAGAMIGAMLALNRWRAYGGWPYVALAVGLWVSLHGAGVHAALAGVILAAFIPTRPAPLASPLLGQAATALAALEESPAQSGKAQPQSVSNWARLNLAAASERMLSPAERAEQAVAPWSAFLVLPIFALTATGVSLSIDVSNPESGSVMLGVALGLVIGKPLGIVLVSLAAVKAKIGLRPADTSWRTFIGAACLCGVGYTVALLLADQAFADASHLQAAKLGVLAGSTVAGGLGAYLIATTRPLPDAPNTDVNGPA